MINDVRPFKALHYNPDKISNIGQCLSQPYDVISPAQQEAYYKQHDNNVIRLILGKINPADNDMDNQYTRAKDFLSQWRKEDILHNTKRSSFWVYEQEFEIPIIGKRTVKGYIGKVRLRDYDEMSILPHEKVMKNPVQDRIKLSQTTNMQFEYIWCLYQDKGFIIDSILDACESHKPIVDYYEEQLGVQHKLWRLVDSEKCSKIQETMGKSRIYIADGHHRYATMLHIRDEYRKKYPDAGPDGPWEFILMYLVNYEHAGLTIRPTHRMLHNLNISRWEDVFKEIETHFHVKRYPWDESNENDIRKKWLYEIQTKEPGEHKFGLYLKNQKCFFLLTLKDSEAYEKLVKLDYSSDWKLLDVNIVNYLLLKQIFKISEEELLMNTKIKYIVDPHEAADQVKTGDMEGVLILNPTRLNDVIQISENREMMPRKSTFFYPKPLSGLVMYDMDVKTEK